jgi:hypothetical protein
MSNTPGATTDGPTSQPQHAAAHPADPRPGASSPALSSTRPTPTPPGSCSADTGVAAGQHVWRTNNLSGGGRHLDARGQRHPDVPVNSITIDPAAPFTLYAATDIGVFATQDGGNTWVPYSESLPRVAVFDIAFQNSAPRVLRIATHGRGIWERTPLTQPVELQKFEIK